MMANNIQGPEAGNATLIASTPMLPRATITFLEAGGSMAPKGPIVLSLLPFVMGRTEGALILQDPNISRKHAQITYDEAQRAYCVEDLNSSNGTFVNAKRIMPGQAVQLSHGTVIALGPGISMLFEVR